MKKLIIIFVSVLAIACMSFSQSALAGDAANGKTIFGANCTSCHMGGKNMVVANKTLSKGDLEKYGMNSLDAIKTQVTKGKNAMPSFNGRLSASDIEDVATYVLAQSEKGW